MIFARQRDRARSIGESRRRLAAIVDTCEPRRLLASVSGVVFNDLNKNGTRDAGEAGVSGITVYADKDYDGVMRAGELRAVTDANGFYRITGIVADGTSTAVRLSGVDPARQTAPTSHSARFASEYEAANRNFGYLATPSFGTVAGRIGNDENGNGGIDPTEGGLNGVRVYADANGNGAFDAGELSSFSDFSGGYSLNLPGGQTYTIRAVLGSGYDPAAWRQTAPTTNGGARLVTVGNGQTLNTQDFNFAPKTTTAPTAIVTGKVYDDADRDGVPDAGEAGVSSVFIWADLNGNGAKDATEPSTVSNADGTYTLTGVPVANVSVPIRAIAPAGATFTNPSGGAHYGRYSAVITYAGRNFGLATAPTSGGGGSITIRTIFDRNGNGEPDVGEDGPSDAILWVDLNYNGLREGGEPLLTYYGVESGFVGTVYSISGLTPREYRVALRLAGDVDQYADYQTDVFVYDDAPSSALLLIPTTSSLGGVVYVDANGNGAKDAGESGTSGITVFADYDFDGVRDANEPQTTTNASGVYKLYGIRSDNNPFRITALLPSGATVTNPAAGYYQARFDRAYDLADQGGRDFGYKTAAAGTKSITVYAFNDLDDDSTQDAGESRIVGATLWIDGNNNGVRDAGEPLLTSPAGANDFYIVEGLAPGTYTVAIRRAGDTDLIADDVGRFVAGATSTGSAIQMPVSSKGVVTGIVYRDRDGDGVRDAGEEPVDGQLVYLDVNNDGLFNNGPGERFTATDEGGFYRLAGLATDGSTNRVGLGWLERIAGASTSQPAGGFYASSSSGATFLSGRDFGVKVVAPTAPATASVSGTVYNDLNGNGKRDAGEPGRAGEIVALNRGPYLYGFSTSGLYAITDAEGRYTIAGIPTGDYSQTLSVLSYDPSNVTAPVGASYSARYFSPIALGGRDFGFKPATPANSVVRGTVFLDTDGDGINDGALAEPGVSGTVWADYDNDGVQDGDEPYAGAAFGTGEFALSVPADRSFTLRAKGGFYWRTENTTSAKSYAIAAGPSGTKSGFDFGLARGPGAIVSGYLYSDLDDDGVRDAGEPVRTNGWVYIDANDNGSFDGGEQFVSVYDGGRYAIVGLPADGRTIALRAFDSQGRESFDGTRYVTLTGGPIINGVDFDVVG